MLFKSQYKLLVDHLKGDSLYFLGTTKFPMQGGEKIINVIGVKLDNKEIYTEVTYHFPLHPGKVTEIVFAKNLDPASFERFLNDLATKTTQTEKDNKLVELENSNLNMDDLSMLDEEQAWRLYMIFLAESGQTGKTRSGFSRVREYVESLRAGTLKADTLHQATQYEIQRLKEERAELGG